MRSVAVSRCVDNKYFIGQPIGQTGSFFVAMFLLNNTVQYVVDNNIIHMIYPASYHIILTNVSLTLIYKTRILFIIYGQI